MNSSSQSKIVGILDSTWARTNPQSLSSVRNRIAKKRPSVVPALNMDKLEDYLEQQKIRLEAMRDDSDSDDSDSDESSSLKLQVQKENQSVEKSTVKQYQSVGESNQKGTSQITEESDDSKPLEYYVKRQMQEAQKKQLDLILIESSKKAESEAQSLESLVSKKGIIVRKEREKEHNAT